MEFQCVCCDFESDNKKDFYNIGGAIEPTTICRNCAAEIYLTNVWMLGYKKNLAALEMYVEIHPEAQPKLDRFLERLKEYEKENP